MFFLPIPHLNRFFPVPTKTSLLPPGSDFALRQVLRLPRRYCVVERPVRDMYLALRICACRYFGRSVRRPKVKIQVSSYRRLNTSGTRLGLRKNSGRGKHESEGIAYVLLKYCLEDVTRAKRCSNVSPKNSGSSLTSTLYFDIIIVMAATLSVSKNLKKDHA